MDIILASGSPRRRELLTQIGIRNYRILVPDVDEHTDVPSQPAPLVEILSRRKAEAVRGDVGDEALIIAADTVVALEDTVLGKPADKADAARMLSTLSARKHQVYTGFTVLRGSQVITGHEVTDVTFRSLTPSDIDHYIATGEPMDKAGAYGIQGFGAVLISGLHGDYFNVMGLPVYRLAQALSEFGIDTLTLACHSAPD